MSFTTPTVPGLDPNANYGPQMNAVGIFFMCLSFATVVLRFFSRAYTKIEVGTDDWLLSAAAVVSWAYTATVIAEVELNFYGQHIGKSDPYHVEEFFKGLYGLAIIYPVALTLSKLSLLALYWRIFRGTKGKLPIQIAAGLNIGWMLAAFFVGIFSCRPVQGFWNIKVPSKCINDNIFFLSNEAFTITLDLIVLLIPIYFISQIQRSLAQRISISSTFLLGLVVTVVSAVRLWRLVLAQRMPGFDPTFNLVDAALWAVVELNLWVFVASIPSLRPLVGKIIRERSEKTHTPSSGGYIYSNSSLRTLKARIWPSKTRLAPHSSGHTAARAESLHSTDHSVPILAHVRGQPTWTSIDMNSKSRNDIDLENLSHADARNLRPYR